MKDKAGMCAIAVASLIGAANAGSQPVAMLGTTSAPYSTLDGAAKAALAVALPLSSRYEHGGALLLCAGSYFATVPVTARDTHNVAFQVTVPAGCTLAGIYHTHPSANENARVFSPGDVKTARALKVRSYIGISADGTVRVFDPETMTTQKDRGRMAGGFAAAGEEVRS